MSLVKDFSCESSDVTVYNLNETGMDKAKEYGVTSVPTVVVNGKILVCCERGTLTKDDLKAAGV